MNKRLAGVSLLVLILLITGCATGKKAFTKGDYYAATLQAISRLRSNPTSKSARETLDQSYPYAIEYYEKQVDAAMALDDPFKYSKIVGYYERLNHLASEIERAPAARQIVPMPKTYFNELREARQQGAEERYKMGMDELNKKTRESSKAAYYHFVEAEKMVMGYKDTHELMQRAKYEATLKVLLQQIPVSGTDNEISSIFFYNQIMEELKKSSTTEFVRFISPDEMEMESIQPDQILEMHFQEFIVGQVHDKETIREVSKDSVVVGQVTLQDGTVLDAYNTVKAEVTSFRRELISNGVLDVQSIDTYTGQVVSQKKFPGQFIWFSEWGSFTGDERALSAEDEKLIKLKPVAPPSSQQLFIEFTKPIYYQVVPYLKQFYNQYK